jgi:hypothetical protein
VSFAFRDIVVGGQDRASRPVIDLGVDGHDNAPQAFLIDTGAGAVRMSAEIAEVLGIELSDAPPSRIGIGAATVDARAARVTLTADIGGQIVDWDTEVWFCEPWPHAFGVAGLTGFLDRFDVTLRACDGEFDLTSRLDG